MEDQSYISDRGSVALSCKSTAVVICIRVLSYQESVYILLYGIDIITILYSHTPTQLNILLFCSCQLMQNNTEQRKKEAHKNILLINSMQIQHIGNIKQLFWLGLMYINLIHCVKSISYCLNCFTSLQNYITSQALKVTKSYFGFYF